MLNVHSSRGMPPSFTRLSPFAAGDHGRPLRFVIDEQTVASSAALDLLRTLSERPGVEAFSTADDAARRIELGPIDSAQNMLPVRYILPASMSHMAVQPAQRWRELASSAAAEHGLAEEETWRALVLAQAVKRHDLDCLVSGAAVLTIPSFVSHAQAANVMTPGSACALLGLFLRAHRDFVVRRTGQTSESVGFDTFYRGAGAAALPELPLWLRVGLTAWNNGTTDIFGFVRGIETRLGRALIARDYFNVRIRHGRPQETWEEALYFFESALLSLRGALDSATRLLHAVYSLSGEARFASFGREGWVNELRGAAGPRMNTIVAKGSTTRAVVQLIGDLRNFIHGEAPSHELRGYADGPEIKDYGKGVIALHGASGDRLRAAAADAHGAESWGIDPQNDGVVLVQPVLFLESALSHTIEALRTVLQSADHAAVATDLLEPFLPSDWLPAHALATELLLLVGLPDPNLAS